MAYIAPTTNIQFFGDLGLSPNYDDTRYFGTTNDKDTWFGNQTKLGTAENCSFTRGERGVIRVQLPLSQIYNAQYMRYKNASFVDKWFYAFVTGVDYINNTTTQVRFVIDTLMTWMGTFTLGQCFVERQHSETDAIGDNLVPENLDIGEYVYINSLSTGFLDDTDDYYTIVCTPLERNAEDVSTAYNFVEGVYSGANLLKFDARGDASDFTALNTFFETVNKNDLQSAVVSVYQVPSAFWDSAALTPTSRALDCTPVSKHYDSISGYVPLNKKLFTYPYNLLRVTNCEGNSQDYRLEFFSTGTAGFKIYFSLLPPVQAFIFPTNYKGLTENIQEILNMGNFAVGAFTNDSYQAFMAQAKSNALMNLANAPGAIASGAATGAAVGGIAGGIIGAAGGAASTVLQSGAQAAQPLLEKVANKLAGRSARAGHAASMQGNPTVNVFNAHKKKDFYFNSLQITAEFAMMIDGFFTMYGYAQKRKMTPKMNARPYFTYVKTEGCIVHGAIPAEDCSEIENIFNSGVRFWTTSATIGNYSVNNAPV